MSPPSTSLVTCVASLLLAFSPVANAYNNGAPNSRLPAMGWSSWVALGPPVAVNGNNTAPVFDYCDEDTVRLSIDAFAALGFYEAGYRHIHLDDCWAGGRNATGYLYPELDHFPNGMQPLINHAHSYNLSYGLYTCAGTQTCVGGRPGSKDHWQQDAAVWAEWENDFVKMDWCNTEGMVPQEAYANMSMALNATGRAISFNMCEWGVDNPWEWGNAVAQSWRMAGDHTGVWSSTKQTVAASAAIPPQYTGVPYGWNDMDMLETGCYDQCAHANGRLSNMSAIEYKTEFSMWSISASPLMFTSPLMNCTVNPPPPATSCSVSLVEQLSIAACTLDTSFGCGSDNTSVWINNGCRGIFDCNGANVTCSIDGTGEHVCECPGASGTNLTCTPWISDLQREILFNTEVIAINQDVTPQGTPIKGPGDLTVWARYLSDGSVGIAFYNQEDTPAVISLTFSELSNGWGVNTVATARDLWAHADLGSFTGMYPQTGGGVTVAPHETHMVRLTKSSA